MMGLFYVNGSRDNPVLEGNPGACLSIAAQAEDAAKLRLRAANVMLDAGLTIVESEQMQEMIDEDDLSEELAKLIPEARRNVEALVCGTWHCFKDQDTQERSCSWK